MDIWVWGFWQDWFSGTGSIFKSTNQHEYVVNPGQRVTYRQGEGCPLPTRRDVVSTTQSRRHHFFVLFSRTPNELVLFECAPSLIPHFARKTTRRGQDIRPTLSSSPPFVLFSSSDAASEWHLGKRSDSPRRAAVLGRLGHKAQGVACLH